MDHQQTDSDAKQAERGQAKSLSQQNMNETNRRSQPETPYFRKW